jgi:hypothetical protein
MNVPIKQYSIQKKFQLPYRTQFSCKYKYKTLTFNGQMGRLSQQMYALLVKRDVCPTTAITLSKVLVHPGT